MMEPKFAFPPSVLAAHVALLGKTGSGKTSTGKLLIEQVVGDGARACILDPIKSDWWGLISSSDGKKPGLPFQILGGPHGHVPLHSGAGKALGELVGRGALPLSIIDMADFEAGGLQKFFVDFAPSLLRHIRGVLYLVMEEAHEFAPKERSGIGAETTAIHYAKKLATAGRSKGLRMMVLSQRTQALHNALLGSCETMIAHRMTQPADQEPVIKWLRANAGKELAETVGQQLAGLKTGTGWMVSPEGATVFTFPKFRTYDNSATPTEDSTELDVKTAPVDVDKLRQILGDAVKEAEENDPKLLRGQLSLARARIFELEHDKRSAPSAEEIERAEKRGYARARGDIASVEQIARDLRRSIGGLQDAIGICAAHAGNIEAALAERGTVTAALNHVHRDEFASKSMVHEVRRPPESAHKSSGDLPAGEHRILTAIAQHGNGVTREQLTVLTGYKKSSRDTYLQKLAQKQLLMGDGAGKLFATSNGMKALGPNFRPLPTGFELRRHWMSPGMLPAGEAKILNVVVNAYPQPVDRGELSARTGYKKSSRDTYIQKLLARQLVTSSEHGIRASSNLFS
jgi:chromosome segregation and condensation protein ScpB